MIRRPFSWRIALLVFAIAISGCTGVVSFQATHLASCPTNLTCEAR